MITISRDHQAAESRQFDLIIIGAGVYGVALALVSAEAGHSCLLLDQKDFGWATSYNSLRTVHGGLRYLQKMDLPRFFESVGERRWFMQQFPGLVTPLPCLMPLYGNGMYRPAVFRIALTLNDLLSMHRNRGLDQEQRLPAGRVLKPEEVIRIFPAVYRKGLKGGALWYDGGMPSSQLVIMEMLAQACQAGANALNYTRVTGLIRENNLVRGVEAVDTESGQHYRFRANRVINAAGPWCRELADSFDRDDPALFSYSIAWNVLFNRPALSSHSLAVKPDLPDARMYFLHGWHGLIMGGTIHEPWPGVSETPMPEQESVQRYLDHLNHAVPGLELTTNDILHIYSGLLPVKKQGGNTLTVREVIKDHGANGGPSGLYTVSGIKFTTARKVAQKTLKIIFPGDTPVQHRDMGDCSFTRPGRFAWDWQPHENDRSWQQQIESIIQGQSVVHLDDLVLRRTTIGDNPARALRAAPVLARLFGWNTDREQQEIELLRDYFQRRSSTHY